MDARKLTVLIVLLSLILIPAAMTGCGSDASDSQVKSGIYTIGPGNLDAEDLQKMYASGTCK